MVVGDGGGAVVEVGVKGGVVRVEAVAIELEDLNDETNAHSRHRSSTNDCDSG